MQSKTKNFRFTEAMCSDLDKLVSVWHCTATEAVARALNQVSVLEDWKAYQAAQQIPESHPAKQEPQESTRRCDTGAAAPEQQPEPDRAQATEDSSQTVTTIAANAAAKPKKPKAAPIPMDKPKRESKGKRYQVRIFARGTKTLLKTFSKYSVDEVVSAANEWLHNNGYPQIDKFTGSSLRWEV